MYKILIVEDDATIASGIVAHLEVRDFAVQCVKDFREVLKEFSAFAPELVLMDVTLPFFSDYH